MLIEISKLEVRRRQRSAFVQAQITELAESIEKVGNLHPPVCYPDGDKWVLVAGERRLTAIKQLQSQKKSYTCGPHTVEPGTIAITPLEEVLEDIAFEAELDENIHRVDLTWQDRARAFAALHEMRSKQNPTQTKGQTADEIAKRSPAAFTSGASARNALRKATVIVQNLDNAKVANARNAQEALNLIYKQEYEKVMAALAKRQRNTAGDTPLPIEIKHGDLLEVLPTLPDKTYDLVLGDPPYGQGASSAGYRQRTVHHHNYDDTPDNAKRIAQCIITEGFRVTKTRANLLLFCDVRLFVWLQETAQRAGWSVFPRPIIWRKSESEGLAPWGSIGPRITTEFILFATKGGRGFNSSPTDVFEAKRVPRHERLHAAEKPVELLKRLIELTTMVNDKILDPCCGSGSTLVAARELQRGGLGIEADFDYYNTAMTNVFGDEALRA